MSCGIITEKSFGLQLTTIANTLGGGTAITIQTSNWSDNYTTMTIYNDTTEGIIFSYIAKDGGTGKFIVPKDKVYTRKLYNTSFVKDSIIATSLNDSSSATGLLTINIGV